MTTYSYLGGQWEKSTMLDSWGGLEWEPFMASLGYKKMPALGWGIIPNDYLEVWRKSEAPEFVLNISPDLCYCYEIITDFPGYLALIPKLVALANQLSLADLLGRIEDFSKGLLLHDDTDLITILAAAFYDQAQPVMERLESARQRRRAERLASRKAEKGNLA